MIGKECIDLLLADGCHYWLTRAFSAVVQTLMSYDSQTELVQLTHRE